MAFVVIGLVGAVVVAGRVVTLAVVDEFNDGGVIFEGVIVCVNVFDDCVVAVGTDVAQNPPDEADNVRNFASTEGLTSAGIKIRIGLWVSIQSPRCPGLSEYNSARLSPVILATSFKFTAPTLI